MKIVWRLIKGFIVASLCVAFKADTFITKFLACSYIPAAKIKELFYLAVILLSVFGILNYALFFIIGAFILKFEKSGLFGIFGDKNYYLYAAALGILTGLVVKLIFKDESEEENDKDDKNKRKEKRVLKKEKRKAEDERIIRELKREGEF